MWVLALALIITILLLLCVRLWYVLKQRKYVNNRKPSTCKIMAVFGSGGHTAEMTALLRSLSDKYTPQVFVVADTDRLSQSKIAEMDREDHVVVNISRSREVGQSWMSTFFTTLRACIHAVYIVLRHRPDLVICNGPGTCIPICGAAFMWKLCFVVRTRIVFVESVCRVTSMSLTGRILYHFADRLLVQWPDLVKKYSRCEYIGRLV